MQDPTGGGGRGPSIDPGEIRELVAALARPRMTGTDGAAAVEAELRRRFDALGYETRELPFAFSTLPGRWGLPLAGLLTTAMAAGAVWVLAAGRATTALAVLAVGLVLAAAPLLFLDRALRLPWARVETANLLFVREAPRWIVMAHRDTKSQWAPTLIRTAALALGLGAWAAQVGLAIGGATGTAPPTGATWAAGGALLAAGVVLALSPAGNASPGALDNGTGLAALLALAGRRPGGVAFLVTDGEELGLAGARAIAGRLPEVAGIVNLDGLDDAGAVRIAEGRAGRRGDAVGAMAIALLEEARRLGLEAVRRPLPPFVLVDHEPLAAAGLPALTVLKGRWRSLLRVHRPADTAARLDGTGAARVATLVLAALGGLMEEPHTLRPDERSGHSPRL